MKYRTIVLICNTPALQTDINTYCLNEVLELGCKLIVIDASPILLPEANRIVTAKRLEHDKIETHICYNYKELESYIKEYAKKACFIPLFSCYYDVRKVFSMFSKYDVFYGHITTARTELDSWNVGTYKKTFKNSCLNPIHLYKALYNRIGRRVFRLKKSNFIILGGSINSEQYIQSVLHNSMTKIIQLHTWDYEIFKFAKKYDNGGRKYCVYLDQYFPFHPDFITEDGVVFSEDDKQKFFDDMNKVFDYIRDTYNYEVIIAAHPRADYENKKDLYPKTKIEYGLTCQLVKGASLVIANSSNSIMFAIMAHLPLLIIHSSVIKKCDSCEKALYGFVNLTKATLIKDVSDLPQKNDFFIDEKRYDYIEYNFIKSIPDNEKTMWQNILENL